MITIHNLTSAQLKQAADIKDQIEALNLKLNEILGDESPSHEIQAPAAHAPKRRGRPPGKKNAQMREEKLEVASSGQPAKKRRMSAAGKAAIRAGLKARWAKFHAENSAAAKSEKPGKKRSVSAAAKAAMSRAAKLRWQKAKAAGKSRL